MRKVLSLFALSSAVFCEEMNNHHHSKRLLPGIDLLLSTFNVLDPLGKPGPRIFDIRAPNETDFNSSCPFYIPDEFLVGDAYSCHLVPKTITITSLADI